VPDPLSILRLAALLAFIGLVALALWLLDVAWWVVPPVMAVALLIAWTIEWLAWRGSMTTTIIRDTAVPGPAPVAPEPMAPAPAPVEAIVPPAPEPEREPALQAEPEPQPVPEPEPTAEPQPTPPPEPTPEAEPTPEPEPTPAPKPVQPIAVEPLAPPAKPPREPRRARRMRLRPVPAPRLEPTQQPAPAPTQQPAPAPEASSVVAFRPRTLEPRSWNLWDLERIAREAGREHPERRDEWSYLFLNLRQFAHADGSLPAEFDGLVRESFAGLLERSPGA
jgi:hypothetical protein